MKKYLIAGSFFLLILLGGLYYLAHLHSAQTLSDKEKQKALENLLGRTPNLKVKKQDTSLKQYNGTLLHVRYPTVAKIYTPAQTNKTQDAFSFGIVSQHVVVSVGVYETTTELHEYGAVVLRQNQSDIYTPGHTVFQKLSCYTFLKTDEGVERSMFCQKDGKILSFVVSGSDSELIDTYFKSVSQSISF